MQDATMIVGMLVGFLIAGVIGVYIGSAVTEVSSLNPSTAAQTRWLNTSDGRYITDPLDPWYANAGNGTWANISASDADSLYGSQQTVIETFELGVSLCKIIIIVSVAGLVFMLLQHLGLIPRLGGGREKGEGGY
jgi:hypothetical protein